MNKKVEVVYAVKNDWTGLPVSYCSSCNEYVTIYLYGRNLYECDKKEYIVNFCPLCGKRL